MEIETHAALLCSAGRRQPDRFCHPRLRRLGQPDRRPRRSKQRCGRRRGPVRALDRNRIGLRCAACARRAERHRRRAGPEAHRRDRRSAARSRPGAWAPQRQRPKRRAIHDPADRSGWAGRRRRPTARSSGRQADDVGGGAGEGARRNARAARALSAERARVSGALRDAGRPGDDRRRDVGCDRQEFDPRTGVEDRRRDPNRRR